MKLFKYQDWVNKLNESLTEEEIREKEKIEELDKLLENPESPLNLAKIQELRDNLRSFIIGTCDGISHEKYNTGLVLYSKIGSNIKNKANPEEDFQKIQEKLNNLGIGLNYIEKLFSQEVNNLLGNFKDFCKRWISGLQLTAQNALVDIYLYFLNKKLNLGYEVGLGGDGFVEQFKELDSDYKGYEFVIKYAYGFHKTNYGRLFLYQNGYKNEESFIEETFVQLKRTIVDVIYEAFTLEYFKLKGLSGLDKFLNGDELTNLLNKNIHYTDTQLIFNIEDFYDEVVNKYDLDDKTYINSKNDIKSALDIVITMYHSAFKMESTMDKIIIS